ncbi:MAG: prephenate dehydrogenase [Alphaproteobacteria bacterium]|nr:prephenate dehydrogenase [Alphaproteobacteria bacterium]
MKKSLGIIGVGAFGAFAIPHLAPYFDLHVYDSTRDLAPLAEQYNVTVETLEGVCNCDMIVLAVPVPVLESVAKQVAPHVKPGQLVMDVASVKVIPADILQSTMPEGVDVIGLHPLFGPKSGRDGIKGLNISVCNIRGDRAAHVIHFLKDALALNVIETTPEEHDREMAYSQALTHIIARAVVALDIPPIKQSTKTYALLRDMIDMISHDSDELFRAIQKYNPYATETKDAFFEAVRQIEDRLGA